MVFEIVLRCVVFYCSPGFVEISSVLHREHSNPEPVETIWPALGSSTSTGLKYIKWYLWRI